jgi:hypothetical protein
MKKIILILTLFAGFNAYAEPKITSEIVGSCKVTSSSINFTHKGDTVKFEVYKVDDTFYDPMLVFHFFDQAGKEISTENMKLRRNISLIKGKVNDTDEKLKIKNRLSWFKADFLFNKMDKTVTFNHRQSTICDWGHCSTYVYSWDLALDNCEMDTTFLKDTHFEKDI